MLQVPREKAFRYPKLQKGLEHNGETSSNKICSSVPVPISNDGKFQQVWVDIPEPKTSKPGGRCYGGTPKHTPTHQSQQKQLHKIHGRFPFIHLPYCNYIYILCTYSYIKYIYIYCKPVMFYISYFLKWKASPFISVGYVLGAPSWLRSHGPGQDTWHPYTDNASAATSPKETCWTPPCRKTRLWEDEDFRMRVGR